MDGFTVRLPIKTLKQFNTLQQIVSRTFVLLSNLLEAKYYDNYIPEDLAAVTLQYQVNIKK